MNDFLTFFRELVNGYPLHMEIYYSKIMDWCITIYKEGCAKDYPGTPTCGESNNSALLCQVQDGDMELCFAKAHVALKEWLLEYEGGY